MTIIEQYLQFAIDNWLTITNQYIHKFSLCWNYVDFEIIVNDESDFSHLEHPSRNIIELITSKSFIESIARWVDKKILRPAVYYSKEQREQQIKTIIDNVTNKQAIAIRDWKLEEFIINLWIWHIKTETKQ